MSSEVIRPCVFVVHDRQRDNYSKVVDQLDLPGTFLVNNITDLHPDENACNDLDDIRNRVFFNADYILVQDNLLKLGSTLVKEMLGTSTLSSAVRTQYFKFDSYYEVSPLEFDKVCEYVGLFTGDISEIGESVMEKTYTNDTINRYQAVIAEEASALAGADIFINEFDEPDDLGKVAVREADISVITQEGEN